MNETTPDVQELIERARRGDDAAREALLERYRDKLNRMVSMRLDRRLAARVDPSDVVQETLAVAARNLDDYLREPPLPFLGWLRHLAAEQVVDAHRHHVVARRRSVHRETRPPEFRDDSMGVLVRRLVANDTSPSNRSCDANGSKGSRGRWRPRPGRPRCPRDAIPRAAGCAMEIAEALGIRKEP